MDKIRKLVILISCLFVIIVILSVFLFLNIKKQENSNNTIEGEYFDYENQKIEKVKENIKYYTVENCINRYYTQLFGDNRKYYTIDDDGQYIKTASKEEINSDICEFLSDKFIEENNINISNVRKYVGNISEKVIFIPLDMNSLLKDNLEKFIVKGYIQTLDNKFLEDLYIIVNLDYVNKTFSIEPVLKKYDNIEDIIIQNENKSIKKNPNNTYIDAKINYEYRTNNYFLKFKRMCLSKPEYAYDVLNMEYREKRFKSLSNFKKYIDDNREFIQKKSNEEFLANAKKGFFEFICKDKYGNLFICKEKNVNEYEIILDTYTNPPKEFLVEYGNSNIQKKVMMNVDKWVQMLNDKDYNSAFSVLDESFINNKFSNNLEQFEKYMRNNFPQGYKIKFLDFSEKAENIFLQKIELQSLEVRNPKNTFLNIVIKIEDGIDFKMSFNLNK